MELTRDVRCPLTGARHGEEAAAGSVPGWGKGWHSGFCQEADARESQSRALLGPPLRLPVCTQSGQPLAQQPFSGFCSEGVGLGISPPSGDAQALSKGKCLNLSLYS